MSRSGHKSAKQVAQRPSSIGWQKEIRPHREIISDDITRGRHHKICMMNRSDEMIRRSKEVDQTDELKSLYLKQSEYFIWLSNMTYREYGNYCIESDRKENLKHKQRREEYIKLNPPSKEIAEKIFEKFELWFKKYYHSAEMLEDELGTNHYFVEPWYWGSIPPGAEKEFYEYVLTEEDYHGGNYDAVFAVCENKMQERLNQLLILNQKP